MVRTSEERRESKPGLGAVLAVGVAEAGFQDAGLGASSDDLERYEDQENPEKKWAVQVEKQAGNGQGGKDVHRIANFAVDAVSDQNAGLRGEGERIAQLIAGKGDKNESADGEDEAEDAESGPGEIGKFDEQTGNSYGRKKRGDEGGAVHGESVA